MILKNKKKIIIIVVAVVIVVLLCGAIVAGVYMASRMNMAEVDVYPVEELYEEMDTESEVLSGEITTDAVQTVYQKSAQEVKKIYVSKGDNVKVGTKLVKYDTTQLELTLEKRKIQKQRLEKQPTKINKEIKQANKDIANIQKQLKKDDIEEEEKASLKEEIEGYQQEILEKKQSIRENTLNIKKYSLEIEKLERQIADNIVKSSVVGVVKKVGIATKTNSTNTGDGEEGDATDSLDGGDSEDGMDTSMDEDDTGDVKDDTLDPDTSGGVTDNALVSIVGNSGYYIQGSLSEAQLDTIKKGQVLHGTTSESGQEFDAKITEISEYPLSDDSSSTQGEDSGGQENSFYPFLAKVTDETELDAQESVDLQVVKDEENSDFIWIDKAFVRTEKGESYVYIADKKKKLKKRKIKVNRIIDGSTAEIESGITMKDKIAFPYGKTIKEGAPVKVSSADSLYE